MRGFSPLILGSIFFALTACTSGGGGSGSGGTAGEINTDPPSYANLAVPPLQGTAELSGRFLLDHTSSPSTSAGSGAIDFFSGETTLTDGRVSITDSNGISLYQELEDDDNTLSDRTIAYVNTSGGTYLRNSYNAMATVRIFDQYEVGSGTVTQESLGVVGIATASADLPTSGTATHNGEAWLSYSSGADYFAATGDVAATTNFGSDKMELRITDIDDGAGNADVPLDTLIFSDIDVSGNSFSGSAYSASLGGSAYEPTGAGSTATIDGTFYGYDSHISSPDEMGGTFMVTGSDGEIIGLFGAD